MKLTIVAALAIFYICQTANANPLNQGDIAHLKASIKSVISNVAIVKNTITTVVVKDALERQNAGNHVVDSVSNEALKEIERAVHGAGKIKGSAGCHAEAKDNVIGTSKSTTASIVACTRAARENKAFEKLKSELDRIQWALNSLDITADNIIKNCKNDKVEHCIASRISVLTKELVMWENAISKLKSSEDNIYREVEKVQTTCNNHVLEYFNRKIKDVVERNLRCLSKLS